MKKALFAIALLAFAAAANATITFLPGSTPQRVKLGETFAPIRVQVTNSKGEPVAGKRVEYLYPIVELEQQSIELCEIDFMSAYHCYSRTFTDSQGVIELPPLKAIMAKPTPSEVYIGAGENYPGENYGSVVAQLSADALGPPKKLTIVSGSNQRTPVGQLFAQPFVVRVTTLDDRPVAGVPVTFSADDSQGAKFDGSYNIKVMSDASGLATSGPFRDTLGIEPGRVRVWATDPDSGQGVVGSEFEYRTTTADGRDGLQLQDIWWSGFEENGWGFTIAQREDRLFPVLFAYDVNGNPTWQVYPTAGWYGRYELARLQAFVPSGSPYFAYDASRFDLGFTRDDTRVTILSEQSLRLDIMQHETVPFTVRQTKSISRHPFSRPQPSPLQGVGGIWWGGPSQAGWGLSITEHPGALFTVWYTYDAFGNPTWFVMPEGTWQDANTYAGTLYKTHSSAWFDTTYDPSRLQVTAVGTFRLRFEGSAKATFEWSAEGHSGSVPIVPLEF